MTHTFFSFVSLWRCLALSRPLGLTSDLTVCSCVGVSGPDVFLISVDERAKHDQQFHSLSPNAGGYITGNTFSLCLT